MKDRKKLDYLIEELKHESSIYKDIEIPQSIDEKRILLRSLMNIRMPIKLSEEFLKIQNEYLHCRVMEKGIVDIEKIPVVKKVFSIWQGDITRLKVDAIVNAANSKMLGCFMPMHSCIDNQIHTYAGLQLREECNNYMEKQKLKHGVHYEQPTAIPVLTDAYNLPARKVIHIVGPIVKYMLTPKLEKDLENCYKNILDMCLNNKLKSVAFCCISTGEFHFPQKKAAEIAINTVEEWCLEHPEAMERIIFNVFKDQDKKYYEELL